MRENLLKTKPNHYYNYLLIDSGKLLNLIDKLEASRQFIDQKIVEDFKMTIIYIGKGSKNRKMFHIKDAKHRMDYDIEYNSKSESIINVWKNGNGIIVLQLFSESNHYVSLSRENAMIRAAKPNITNIRNGSAYGVMKTEWTNKEILAFGNNLLYYALKKCIIEQPSPIFPTNLMSKKKKPKDFIRTNYEYDGIMELFLEL